MDWPEEEKMGLVLSGGGIRGMAHIGALEVLREYGVQPKWVAGSSAGALIGALYAQGIEPKQMLRFFKDTPLFQYNFFSLTKPGLFDTERYEKRFRSQWPEDSFESLSRPLFVSTTNLVKGEVKIFHEGPLIQPLLASAALPPIFSPVKIGSDLFADGGIMNNFPKEALDPHTDFIIGSNVSVVGAVKQSEITSSYQLTSRTMGLMMYAINKDKIKNCDLIFEPLELARIRVLDKGGIEKAYTIGYDHARKVMENL